MDKITEVHIAAWLACALFVILLFNAASKAVKNLKGKEPTPPNEHLELSHRDLERRVTVAEAAIMAIRSELGDDREKVEASSRARSAALYGKMEDLRRELAEQQSGMRTEMEKGFKDMERAIGRLEGKMS